MRARPVQRNSREKKGERDMDGEVGKINKEKEGKAEEEEEVEKAKTRFKKK